MTQQIISNLITSINFIAEEYLKSKITMEKMKENIQSNFKDFHDSYENDIEENHKNIIYSLFAKMLLSKNEETTMKVLDELKNELRTVLNEMKEKEKEIKWEEEIKKRIVLKHNLCSELMVPEEMDYNKRMEIFKNYILNEIKPKQKNDITEVKITIQKLVIILILPICIKDTYKSDKRISFTFYCRHSGKTKETCKGRDCKYKLIVHFIFDGSTEIIEKGEHNHRLDYSFIITKTCPLLKSERELIPETKDELNAFYINHQNSKISLKKFKEIQRTKSKELEIDNKFLKYSFVEDEINVKITNTFTNNYIHSITFIHKKVAKLEYSKRIWYIDDTAKTNIYDKNLITILVKDDNSFNQILSFGYLFDQTKNSYYIYLKQVHNILGYEPNIIVCDRCVAQFKALNEVFPNAKKFYCRIHIERSLNKYFKGKNPIIKSYRLMMNMKLKEKDLIEAWKEIIKNNTSQGIIDEDNEIEEEEEENYDEENKENQRIEEEKSCDIINLTEKDINVREIDNESLLEKIKKKKIKKGILCLKDLVEHSKCWVPSECIKYGMYRDFTTNRIEGFFGSLKKLTEHEILSFNELTSKIKILEISMFNKILSVELPDGIIDKNDQRFNSLTEFTKKVLKYQYNMLKDIKICKENVYCISCKIRNETQQLAWPCCHLMKKRKELQTEKYLINYDDLPIKAFKSKNININIYDCSIKDIKLPDNYIIKGKVVMNEMKHNTNCRPRNKVEFRKRTSKEVIFNEIIPFQPKRKVIKERKDKRIVISNNEEEKEREINEEEKEREISEEEEETKEISEEEREMSEEKEEERSEEEKEKEEINEEETKEISEEKEEEINEYDKEIKVEQFIKIMNTFVIPKGCILCEISRNNKEIEIPKELKGNETIIFPYKRKLKYGLIVYVDKIIINNKERNNCLVHIKDRDIEYPCFMKNSINKKLKQILNLNNDLMIYSINLKEHMKQFKNNGYNILYLIEEFIKKRDDDKKTRNPKNLVEYINKKRMKENFNKYEKLI